MLCSTAKRGPTRQAKAGPTFDVAERVSCSVIEEMCKPDQRDRIAKNSPVIGATVALIQPLISFLI
jgi:hypothetical protein